MDGFDDIIRQVSDFRSQFEPVAGSEIVRRLMDAGRSIVEEAYATKETRNIRYNQHDAYGYAVYYDGAEIPGTRGYLGSEMSTRPVKYRGKPVSGRPEVDSFLGSYKAKNGNFLTLVAVNAMFYSEMQENGAHTLTRSFRILSQTYYRLDELQQSLEADYGTQLKQSNA